jgi:adenylosuccinate lyase
MNLSPLTAISPIDGRYREKIEALDLYFSEYALIRYRIFVEVEYFIALVEAGLPQLKSFDRTKFPLIKKLYRDYSEADA